MIGYAYSSADGVDCCIDNVCNFFPIAFEIIQVCGKSRNGPIWEYTIGNLIWVLNIIYWAKEKFSII